MQHSLAQGRSTRAMPRFVAPSAHGREARLGLRRAALVVAADGQRTGGARLGLRDRRGMTVERPRRRMSGLLRRAPVLRWAIRPAALRLMAPLQRAPWRR